MTINLKVPDVKELRPRITVFGVGGAGGNAVNNMIQSGLQGVDFVVANTDAQALMMSSAERRIQMGSDLTEGLGAGSHPEIGRAAAEEVIDEIRDQLSGVHMAFITAGMGGGTGTGAAPVIARTAREQGILTVGVVTKPFQFEGQRRLATAERGILDMQKHVDTLIVIPNQNLFRVANEKTTFADAFAMADQVLYSGVACITDLIVKEGLINLDFADVRAVMSEMGKAMMGTGESSGEKRAVEAAEAAIANPLLDDVSMKGAKGLLISITGGQDLTLYEVDEAASRIREEVDSDANIILGATFDDALEGVIRVSVVATGIGLEAGAAQPEDVAEDADRAAARPQMRVVAVNGREPEDEPATENGVTLKPFARGPQQPEPEDMAQGEPEEDAPFIPPAAERADRRVNNVRMPHVEDFPLNAQKQMRAASGEEPDPAHEVQSRFSGFFRRLASAGLGARDEGDDDAVASEMASRIEPALRGGGAERAVQPRIEAEPVREAAMGGHEQSDHADDDHLEIPAFLRRQAN